MTSPVLPLAIEQIDHAAWTVPDLDAAIAFYERLFGARQLYRLGPINSADLPRSAQGKDWTHAHLDVPDANLELAFMVLPNGFHIELFAYTQPASDTQKALKSNHVGAHHLGFLVADLDQAVAQLEQHGCTVLDRIAFDSGPTAGAQFQYFTDPWGNIFELVQRSAPLNAPQGRECVNPASLYNSTNFGFSHAVVQDNSRTVHLAGQVAWNGEGQLVGAGDRIAQTRQALQNLKTVLKEAGASPRDVVRLRTYLVGHTPEELGPICALINEFYEGAEPAANTLLGVANLALPDMLVEIEATARLP